MSMILTAVYEAVCGASGPSRFAGLGLGSWELPILLFKQLFHPR